VEFNPFPDQQQYLRIQVNTALDFEQGGDRAHFHLVRTKCMFATKFQTQRGDLETLLIGGELIDVTVIQRDDSGLAHFFEQPNANLEQYELTYRTANGVASRAANELRFNGYSLGFLLDDLDLILFIRSNTKPWSDPKYEKRLNRLFYLSFLQTFTILDSNVERKNFIRDMCERVITKAFKKDIGDRVTRFLAKYHSKSYSHYRGLYFMRFVRRIAEVQISPDDDEFSNYKDFVENAKNNCVILLKTFANLRSFCSEGAISSDQIYEGSFSSLI
jgi:hypothetical protein